MVDGMEIQKLRERAEKAEADLRLMMSDENSGINVVARAKPIIEGLEAEVQHLRSLLGKAIASIRITAACNGVPHDVVDGNEVVKEIMEALAKGESK